MYDFSKFVRSYTILRWSLSNNNQYNFKGMKSFRLKIRDGWTHNVLPPSDQIAFQLYDNSVTSWTPRLRNLWQRLKTSCVGVLKLVKTWNETDKLHLKINLPPPIFLLRFKNISRKKQDKNNHAAHCFFRSENYHCTRPYAWYDTKIVRRLCQEN